jgi:tetracycline repressor-like protein
MLRSSRASGALLRMAYTAIAWLERGLDCLGDTGLAEGEKLSAILLLTGFVRNEATLDADISAAKASGATPHEVMASYGRLLARLTDAQRFPALHTVIASGVLDEPDDFDAEFVFGLERVLDGVEALVVRRREPSCGASTGPIGDGGDRVRGAPGSGPVREREEA